ncbi:hypothetical protein CSUB01_07721 [Colletotrichum sublineola]|uniref:Uncharacterized protein n=1 Tax=Colletotrichum sublineola TaxID=1173701 RepID=A0A066X3F5_COLSU|nr:hypothetical protein CSUB01_07721 [Colletotrichum sublineola]
MESLLSLPLEITHQILTELTGPDPEPRNISSEDQTGSSNNDRLSLGLSSMAKLSRTCRQLHAAIEPRLYRSVHIPQAGVPQLLSLLKSWSSLPHRVEYTQRLFIKAKQHSNDIYREAIADQDIIFVSTLVEELGLQLRSDWHEFAWRVDVLTELVMFAARNAQWMDISFIPKRGIYRGSFDWLSDPNTDIGRIRFDNLRHLRLFQQGRLTMDEIQPVINRSSGLQSLYLDTIHFTGHHNRLPASLTALYLSRCSISPSIFRSLTTDLNKLRDLEYDISGRPRQMVLMMQAISEHKRTLKSLLMYFHLDSELEVDMPLYALDNLESLTTDLQSFGLGGGSRLMALLPASLRELRVVPFISGHPRRQLELFAAELRAREELMCTELIVQIDGQDSKFDYHRVLNSFAE